MSEEKKSSINWGGLCKGLLAGAAIVAGIAFVCPGALGEAIKGVQAIGTGLTATATAAAPAAVPAAPSMISQGMGWLITKVAGIVGIVMGANYLLSDKGSDHEERHAAHRDARESFVIREDMRKMNAVVQMRMQAAGHAPAMGGQGRG